ncbi:MAG: DUF2797 domain-containing protein [Leptospiraceae bacterium]|nr:DUF2797 domain-containing protein [Leptospiraceae bacterium]
MLEGYLRMMGFEETQPLTYYLNYVTYSGNGKQKEEANLQTSEFSLNSLLGKKVQFYLSGLIRCVDCGRSTKKAFGNSCYSCFIRLAKNDTCMVHPETCHFLHGTCREPDWGKENCIKKHTIYLANTSGLKVGITREEPPTKRWVDQGAIQAIPILEVKDRKTAGEIEKFLANSLNDKTSWQKMIGGKPEELNLSELRRVNLEKLPDILLKEKKAKVQNKKETSLEYPVIDYKSKKVSYKPGKILEDELIGIKGQYLLFRTCVINLRTYSGYHFTLSF